LTTLCVKKRKKRKERKEKERKGKKGIMKKRKNSHRALVFSVGYQLNNGGNGKRKKKKEKNKKKTLKLIEWLNTFVLMSFFF